MKTLLIIATLCFVGCAPADSSVKTPNWHSIQMGGGMDVTYKIVVIDGNEYFATRTTHGYITLCPRLPPKTE